MEAAKPRTSREQAALQPQFLTRGESEIQKCDGIRTPALLGESSLAVFAPAALQLQGGRLIGHCQRRFAQPCNYCAGLNSCLHDLVPHFWHLFISFSLLQIKEKPSCYISTHLSSPRRPMRLPSSGSALRCVQFSPVRSEAGKRPHRPAPRRSLRIPPIP
jgi:hypothetical protein